MTSLCGYWATPIRAVRTSVPFHTARPIRAVPTPMTRLCPSRIAPPIPALRGRYDAASPLAAARGRNDGAVRRWVFALY